MSFLSVTVTNMPFQSLEEMVEDGTYTWGTEHGALYDLFKVKSSHCHHFQFPYHCPVYIYLTFYQNLMRPLLNNWPSFRSLQILLSPMSREYRSSEDRRNTELYFF